MSLKYSEYMSDVFINEVLQSFFVKYKAKRTIEEYLGYLRILCDEARKDFLDIEEDDVELIIQRWDNKKLARRTIRTRLSCYNSLAEFIKNDLDKDLNFINPFENIIRPEISDNIKPQKVPTLKEVDAIISQVSDEPMWFLILGLVTRACLSPSKITQITKDSIFKDGDKTGLYFKDKSFITLPKDIEGLFNNYVETLTLADEEGHIFFNKHGRALTLKNIDTKFADIVLKAGIEEHYTLINLRSRAILELAKAGVDENTLANYANLGARRTRQFIEAKGILEECPADLVNFRLIEN